MKTLLLTADIYNDLEILCEEFEKETGHDVDTQDVLFTYFNHPMILNDWDEGPNNDPHWNKTQDKHSAIVFINDMCAELDKLS